MTAYVRFANALAWHAAEVALGLHRRGHEVLLLCQKDSLFAERLRGAPFAVHASLNLNRFGPSEGWLAVRELRSILREFRPDILNPHCPAGHAYLAIVRAWESGTTPLVRTVADPRPPKRHPLNVYLHERLTQGLIFTTDSSRQRYTDRLRLDPARTTTILPGFRADEFRGQVTPGGYRVRLGLQPDRLFAAVVARLSPEKGQEVLLQALARLDPSHREQIFCLITGEDARERGYSDLQRMTHELAVESCVAFAPRLDDVRPLMAELDLGIVTSTRSEAICRVALEYMAFGVPVVASDTNILPEVVRDGENGWIYPHDDPLMLADCLHQAVTQRDELRRRGQAGHRLVRSKFSIDEEIAYTLRFFERCSTA